MPSRCIDRSPQASRQVHRMPGTSSRPAATSASARPGRRAAAQKAGSERGEVLRGHRVLVEVAQAMDRIDTADVEVEVPKVPEGHRELARGVLDTGNRLRRLEQLTAQRDIAGAVQLHTTQ